MWVYIFVESMFPFLISGIVKHDLLGEEIEIAERFITDM